MRPRDSPETLGCRLGCKPWLSLPICLPHRDTPADVHPPPSLTKGTGADLCAAYLQIVPLFLLNFVVIEGKVTHFCPNLTTFVPTIRNIYEDMIEIGLKHTSELTVTDDVTAITVGSGDMPVLATPMMMALMENAAMLAVADELPEGCTTVGGHIESSHLKPSKIGDVVRAEAEVTKVDGKKIEFKVVTYSGETLLGEGTHLRFIVDREKFMSRLG